VPGERAEIHTSYFDFEDDQQVRIDLWVAAKADLHAADLILSVQQTQDRRLRPQGRCRRSAGAHGGQRCGVGGTATGGTGQFG
jgi:hypothetical protein